jgi:hypothetical protein
MAYPPRVPKRESDRAASVSAGRPDIAWVGSASAGTTRSSLDLLSLRYPFGQVRLLRADEFAEQAGRRRSRTMDSLPHVNVQVLEVLHRHGVLVPLFRVDLTPGDPHRQVDISESLTAQHVLTTLIAELLRGAAEGRAADPAIEGFSPWPTERRRAVWPSVDSGYLYSRHQLLGFDVASSFVAKLTGQRTDKRLTWHLAEADRPNAPTLEALRTWRSLAITLSALDTYYWPFITHMLRPDLDVWRSARLAFEPTEMLAWLGLPSDQITVQESNLRLMGTSRDNLGDFYDIVRRARADAWDTLSGDALAAMDCRLAADVLDHYAEELNLEGRPSFEHTPLDQQGLSARLRSLDATLTDLRLSPFPSLVIGVEGATEYKLVPRVMNLLEIALDRNLISVIDFGGTDRDLALLARYAAEPVLGKDYDVGVTLERPMTRFLVLTDAEHKYETAADRRYQRKLLLDSLTKNVPADLRGDFYSNTLVSRIVEIRTWGRLPFEFAHFTDRQLANTMLGAAKVPYPKGRAALVEAIHMQRTCDPSPNVDDVFWRRSGLSKTTLADALWPVLEKRIRRAIERGQQGPPIMRAIVRAYEMAAAPYRSNMMLRRKK